MLGPVSTPIVAPLTPPQLAVLQKPPDAAPLAPASPRPPPRAAQSSTAPPTATGRGRLLDIVV
jgi:hypothetical protein